MDYLSSAEIAKKWNVRIGGAYGSGFTILY